MLGSKKKSNGAIEPRREVIDAIARSQEQYDHHAPLTIQPDHSFRVGLGNGGEFQASWPAVMTETQHKVLSSCIGQIQELMRLCIVEDPPADDPLQQFARPKSGDAVE